MRLLHTHTYELRTFVIDVPPPYAILSHTWGDEEVTFKDINTDTRTDKKGWQKVFNSCRRAADDGWEYIWIDTCCIDKSDTTELGEAINSMFRWYEEAQICYAYLTDVPERYLSPSDKSLNVPWKWHFRSSRWFTRGWTLQELLAPTFLLFVDKSWGTIGSREEWADEIRAATSIEVKQLLDFRSCCVATKLSWAANRQTTREEDHAYSLLGILGVNMPLIYGEGKRAFIRLQHELIRSYNDETIFVWGDKPSGGHVFGLGGKDTGILATSTEEFMHSNGLITWPFDKDRRGFAMTNAGLSINAELFEFPGQLSGKESLYVIQLNCSWEWLPLDATKSPMVLLLQRTQTECAFSKKRPVFLKRISGFLRNWSEINSSDWRSLGKQDVLIAEESGPIAQISPSDIIVTFVNPPEITLGEIHKYFQDPSARMWSLVDGPGSYDDPFSGEGLEIRVSRYQAVAREIVVSKGTTRTSLGIIVKWAPRFLSFGIWKNSSFNLNDIIKRLDSDRERPYPSSAVFPENLTVRVTMTPKPVHVSRAHKEAYLKITLEED